MLEGKGILFSIEVSFTEKISISENAFLRSIYTNTIVKSNEYMFYLLSILARTPNYISQERGTKLA